MEQGTQEWLAWRRNKIGASDSASILGLSTYATSHQLWLVKTGQEKEKEISAFANQKGGEAEQQLRAKYSIFTGRDYQPRLAEYDTFPAIACSLDGYCSKSNTACEIKFIGKEKYDNISVADQTRLDEANGIPAHHYVQVQHQMLCTGLPYIDYIFTFDKVAYKVKKIYACAEFQATLESQCRIFWQCVIDKRSPGLNATEEHPVKDKAGLKILKAWRRNALKISKLEAEQATLENQFYPFATATKMLGAGVRVRKGLSKTSFKVV